MIYEVLEDSGFLAESLSLPVLSGLKHYRNRIRYRRDGKIYEARGFDNQLDVNMPDWSLSSDIDNKKMTLIADNQAVDFYFIQFKKSMNLNSEDERKMTWNYRVFGKGNENKSAPRLQIPTVITDAIGEDFYKDTSDLSLSRISALDYDEFNSFEEIMDWVALIQNNPTIDQTGFRQITFPLPTVSGKGNSVTTAAEYAIAIE